MTEILAFAGDHPIVAVLVVWAVCSLLKTPFWALNRYFRSRNIKHHGWPTTPMMDADGDIVYPEKDA